MNATYSPRRNSLAARFDTNQKMRDAGYERCDLCHGWRPEDALAVLHAPTDDILLCKTTAGPCLPR